MGTKNTDAIYDARTLGKPKMLVLGFQHMFAMFGATILVPILTGLDVSTTLLFAGLGTLLFHLITGGKVPAFLGSSFAFLGGYATIAPSSTATSPTLRCFPTPASAWPAQVLCTSSWPLCSRPVSYTHLDVYKRQIILIVCSIGAAKFF